MKTLLTFVGLLLSLVFASAQQPLRNQFTTNQTMNAPADGWISIWNDVAKRWSNGVNVASGTNIPAYLQTATLTNLAGTGLSTGATNASAYIGSAAGSQGTNTTFYNAITNRGNEFVSSNMWVTGNTVLSGWVDNGSAVTNRGVTVMGGPLTVTNDTTLRSNLTVNLNQTVLGNSSVAGSISAGSETITNQLTDLGNLFVASNQWVTGNTTLSGWTLLNGFTTNNSALGFVANGGGNAGYYSFSASDYLALSASGGGFLSTFGAYDFRAPDGATILFEVNTNISYIRSNLNVQGTALLRTTEVTNGLTMRNVTASRAAVFDSLGQLTNVTSGSPSTEFVRADGTAGVPAGGAGGPFNTSQFSATTVTNLKDGVVLTNAHSYASLNVHGNQTNDANMTVAGNVTVNSQLFVPNDNVTFGPPSVFSLQGSLSVDSTNIIHSNTEKTVPATNDFILVEDLAAGLLKKEALANLPISIPTKTFLTTAYQPLDSDLTDIASLVTTAYGDNFLTLADATAARVYISSPSVAELNAASNKVWNAKLDNLNGLGTNETLRGVNLPSLTASRAAIIDGSGNLTNITSGSPTTEFVRADGVAATPPGGSATPGGITGNIQVNNAGTFVGSTNSFYDVSNQVFTIGTPVRGPLIASHVAMVEMSNTTPGIIIRNASSTNLIGVNRIGNETPEGAGGATQLDFRAGATTVFRIDSVGGIISGRPSLATDARNWGTPDRLWTTNATKWIYLTNGIILALDDTADIGQPNVGIRTNYANTIINKDGIFGAYDGITPFPLNFGIFNSNAWQIKETTPIAALLPASSNFNDIGSFSLPVRTNWANALTAKQGIRDDGSFALTPAASTQSGTNTVLDGNLGTLFTNRFNSVAGGLTNMLVTILDGQKIVSWIFPSNGVTVAFPQFTASQYLDGGAVTPMTNQWSEVEITRSGDQTNINVKTATFALVPGNAVTFGTNFVGLQITQNVTRVGVYRTIYVDAAAMVSNTTAGATFQTEQSATPTNRMVDEYVFDGANSNIVQFKLSMPLEWDLSTIKVKLWTWTTNNVATTTNVYGLAATSLTNGMVLTNADWGTEQTITNVVSSAAGGIQLSPATPSLTVANANAAGNLVWFRLRRIPQNSNDNDPGQSKVLGAWVQYKEGTTEPASW